MQLLRLRLVNFRQHADTELEFGPGITGIIGPNGSGKTSILEAIAWALYGVQAVSGDKDSIRRLGAKGRAGVEVDLEFRLGAHEYRVKRGLSTAVLHQDGQVIANSLKAVTDKLERTLGMTHDEFFNTYFTGQKELAVMAALGKTERAAFLSRVLGYERLREAQERVREVRNGVAAEVRGLEAGLPDGAALAAARQAAEQRLSGARRAGKAPEAARRVAEEGRTLWVRDRQYAETKRTELLKQYEEVKEQRDQIVKLGPQGTCPTCKRPLGPEYAGVLALLDAQLEVITGDGKYFRQRLEQLAQPPTKLSDAEAERDRVLEESRRASARAGELRAQVEERDRASAELVGARRRVAERAQREREIAALKARQRLHNELDRAFSDLRGELNARMRPEIAELASGFLADLTDGRYDELELTEDYTLTILEGGVPKPVISGGEEDIASLVLRLAISQMIAERAGQPLSLLVLDEIFGSLDEARRLHVVGLLRRLADRFPQVILITHIEQVREGLDRVSRWEFGTARVAHD